MHLPLPRLHGSWLSIIGMPTSTTYALWIQPFFRRVSKMTLHGDKGGEFRTWVDPSEISMPCLPPYLTLPYLSTKLSWVCPKLHIRPTLPCRVHVRMHTRCSKMGRYSAPLEHLATLCHNILWKLGKQRKKMSWVIMLVTSTCVPAVYVLVFGRWRTTHERPLFKPKGQRRLLKVRMTLDMRPDSGELSRHLLSNTYANPAGRVTAKQGRNLRPADPNPFLPCFAGPRAGLETKGLVRGKSQACAHIDDPGTARR
ncbi:hypothetical protein B0T26DRAFT_696048 [Lasiosphaeria miniovina]|uniref:Uncharacterized protein n=1 Tax=Lasiosphaeria miniovina TaxID=1954250 RepID=A0AA40E7H5_9PEZI|nr:uncharacterized protein B0T26DRAFT_696048 [Lasiosphaeria miniovina]KAK0727912.1 hypothetical protein B0T26DRAFT_696048 [Lasiosphaeria miniovina]